VAARLSLSFPLLISAVPLWTIDRRVCKNQKAWDRFRDNPGVGSPPGGSELEFSELWFTDGGFCSNFPVHLFDAALPSRPTFAINLGRFRAGKEPDEDQSNNVEWAKDNNKLPPSIDSIPTHGFGALFAFGSAAFNTARNWQDGAHLDYPGYRDRIVRVLQTKSEGGLNLYMTGCTIDGLADRGGAAASAIVEQFQGLHYPRLTLTSTGWDNHRWVRYRALLSALPEWLASYAAGRAVLDVDPAFPPSLGFANVAERQLATDLAAALDSVAYVAAGAPPGAIEALMSQPRPMGAIRRIPQI
jgi:hypothetical protein